jgi:hypothetical protein
VKNVSSYNILQAGLTIKNGATDVSGNYNITYNGTTFAIVQRPITIDVTTGQDKIYGVVDPTFAYTYTATSNSPAEGLAFTDAFSGALTRAAGENVSSYNILQAGLTLKNGATDVSGNYDITYNGATFAIVPRPITIDVTTSQSKVYGANDPVFVYTYTPTSSSPAQGLAFTDALAVH